MKQIHKIMCCCGNGVGTSLLMQMTVEEALEQLGRGDIEVAFGPVSDIPLQAADMYVVSNQYTEDFKDYPILGLEDLADADFVADALKPILEG